MERIELERALIKLNIPFNEWVSSKENTNIFPRVVFWCATWESHEASSKTFKDIETYQISFYSDTPNHRKLFELRNELKELGVFNDVFHEYNQEERVFHSYMAIELDDR